MIILLEIRYVNTAWLVALYLKSGLHEMILLYLQLIIIIIIIMVMVHVAHLYIAHITLISFMAVYNHIRGRPPIIVTPGVFPPPYSSQRCVGSFDVPPC